MTNYKIKFYVIGKRRMIPSAFRLKTRDMGGIGPDHKPCGMMRGKAFPWPYDKRGRVNGHYTMAVNEVEWEMLNPARINLSMAIDGVLNEILRLCQNEK